MHEKFINQIYYNKETLGQLDPGFIPLDNTKNERPDWYEFWPMRNFLNTNALKDGCWYGFLSTKFRDKVGMEAETINAFIDQHAADADILLFSYCWDQIAYFQNQFYQGEYFHPGILDASQEAMNALLIPIDLRKLVSHSLSSAYSNFIIAKPKYWKKWLEIANPLFDYFEAQESEITTSYGTVENQTPMKTFIQERLPSILMSINTFHVVHMDQRQDARVSLRFLKTTPEIKWLLLACDQYKVMFDKIGDESYLQGYLDLRKNIDLANR